MVQNYFTQFSFRGYIALITGLVVSLTTMVANAQINYTRTTFTGAYVPITVGGGATQISTVGTGLGDFTTIGSIASGTEGAAHIPLPFDFTYNGVFFGGGINFIGVTTNGYVYPTAGATNATKIISAINTNLFTITTPNTTIAPYWDDLTIGTAVNGITGSVLHQTTGSPGSQVMTIQYTNVPAFFIGNVKALNFQVKLYETTNVIEFIYGPMTNGTVTGAYNIAETASIGIESSLGGNNNYIDAVTGSKTANMSMMTSNKFTTLLNFRFTPGAPAAVAGGTYNVGVGQTYPSLSEAVADLNHRGISGAVSLNLTDAVYDTTVAGGNNIFPIVMSNIAGTSAINTITISRIGSHADLRYRGTDQGGIGNQTGTATIGTTFEPMFCLVGTDWLTVNNVDFTYNGVQGTTAPYQTTNGKVDNSIGVINSSSTDGATNNTFSNFVCTGDRTCTGGGQAIRHFAQTTPTSALGANGGNTYRDFVIKNGTSGFLISGTATFPDINNRIITSSCNTYNIIGDPAVANDMQNPNLSTSPFGITMSNQSGFTVSNNIIQNLSNTNATSNIVDGINIVTFLGTCVVSNNIIKNLRQNTASATATLHSGIKITNTTVGAMEIRVFNNSISGITSAYNGIATATRIIRGINCVSTANNTAVYSIYNNSVSIDGSGSLNGSNTCFEVAGTLTTAPQYDVRNNIFANFTAAQTGLNVRHNCYNTNSSTLLGGTGTTVNQNDMYIANDAGVSGFIGWNTSLLVGFNPVATFNAAFATQVTAANVSGDPLFFNNNGNLHATNSALLAGTGSAIPVYITTDLDCTPRVLPQHIGAYLAPACVSGIPTVTLSPAGSVCSGFAVSATTSAVSPQYQWILNGVEIFGATSASYTPTASGSLTCRVNNTGENCFGTSAANSVSQSPTISVTPATASVCDGLTVNLTATVTNVPSLGYTVASIPSAPIAVPGSGITVFTNNAGGGAPVIPLSNGTLDDGRWDNVSLPFTFNYFGSPFSIISITTNGGVQFGSQLANLSNTGYGTVIPAAGVPNNHFYGFNIDQDWRTLGIIRTWVDGISPNRTFVIDCNGGQFFSATGNVSYQLHIKENGSLETHITTTTGSANAGAIGVENSTGTVAFAAPGRNTVAASSIVPPESWRFAPIAPPTYTYAWSPATGLSSTSVANPVSTPVLGTTIYTAVVTESGAGCTVSGTTSITNLGAGDPAPTTTSAGICAGATGTLSASGLSTLNWYTLPVGGTLVNTGPTYTLAFPATATYYVESFNGICPSGRTPVTITVTANPSTTPTAVPSAICLGGTSQLDAGTFLSGTLATPLNQNNGSSATGFDIENISASPVTLHFFQFQSSSILGTVGIQQIWMNTTPMNCTFPTNVTIAPGWVQIANVSTTSAGTSPILTTIPFDVNITIPAGAKFAFAIGGALGQSYTTGVTLCPTPVILGTTPHIRVFQGFGGTLTGTIANRAWNGTVTYQFGDPNLNFAWSPAGDLNSSTIKSPIATPTTVGPNPYTVTVTNLAGCTSTATVTVTAVAFPLAPSAVVNSVPCGNGAASLSASGSGGTFKWYANASGGTALFTGANYSPVIASDTTFYVSETTLAAPFCEGPRTAVFVDIVDPDIITATVDIPLICSPALVPPTTVTLTATNVSIPQLNQYQYTWTAPVSGGLVTSTGAVVTAVPTATTTYTVTAQQIGNLTVNINGVSPNGPSNQDEITWTLKDASLTTILSGGPYAGFSNNVTSLPVLSNNGPFTFQITAGNALNDTNFANFTVFCEGNVIASGCVKGALNTGEACLNIGTVTVPGLAGCFGSCNRIATVLVGVGATPTVAPTGTILIDECDSALVQLNANAVSSNFITVNANIGNGTVQNGTTTQPAPYGNFFDSNRSQMLIRASELSAAGLSAGSSLSEIKFDVVNTNGTLPLEGFTISLGHTGLTALTSGSAVATPSTVFGPVVSYTPVVGINTHVFSAPFVWDGVSSIVVNTCHFNVNFTNNCTFNQTITPFVSTTSIVADNVSQCAAAPNAQFSQRPNITFTATAGTTVSVSWSPSAGLSSSTVQNPTVKIDGTTTYTVTATENGSGCSATSAVTVNFTPTPIPAAPAALGDVVCGPDIVNLSATAGDINNVLIWTDTIGGQILAVGPTFNPYVTTSGSYYVREVPPIAPVLMNNNIGTSAGFFPDNASFMNFTVTAAEGVIINSVQVSTNAPVSNAPLVIALVNNLGQIVSVLDTFFLSAGGVTALQTINLGLYVPQGSWRLQPILNPNLNVSNTSTLPSTIPGKITVTCFGNVSNPCFPVTFNGLFYNWDVSAPCAGPPTIVNYTVTTPPAGGVASSGGLSFCDTINTTLTAIDSTLSGYDGFTWSPATGLSATTGSSVVVTNVLSSTTYTVVMNNSVSGCNNIATINLTVNPGPSLLLSYTDTTVCTSSPDLTFNSTAAKSSVVPVGNRFNPNFINGQVYGGNATQRSQMIFTAADLNAAGLIGPTNITSLAYFVVNKLTTTTYNITMSMRADGLIPAAFPSTAHITTGLTPVFNNPAITSTLGWNTYVFNTPFLWDGVSNVLIDQCFIHNIAGFFDIVATSPTSGVSFNALNASACAGITGAFIAAPNQNDRPNVRFTGGNVLYSWSPATGLSSTSVEDPVLTVSALVPNTMNPYILTVTDPISGCQKIDTINVNLLSVPLAPTASGVTRCGFGSVNLTATTLGGFTLRWFDAPTGGTQLGTGSPFSYFVGATDTVYVEEYNGGCAGPRTEVIITVTPSPDVTVSATNNPICDGNGPAVLTASSVNPDYIYEWSPATGLSATTGASVNANPLANTTYTVLAIDNLSGCQDTASITVIIGNSIPISGIIPTKSTICIGDSSVLVSGVNITGNYALTSIPFAPITPTGAPTILQNGGILVTPLSAGSADDGTWQNISLPPGFAFNYYGTTPTAVSVSTNGFLTFTATSALSGCCSGQLLPNATTPNDVLAYGWEDWNQTAGTTDVFTNGVAPFRKFVVRSQGIPRFGGTGAPTTVMVVLNETFNTIEMHVTSIVCGAGDITTLGIENAAGTLGVAVPGRNAVAAWTAANEGWLFSPPNPASFAWSPATGLSSTSVSAPTATPATTTTYTVTVINNVSGCTSTSSVTINVLPIPTKPVITGPSVNCGPAILTFTSDAPDTVKWFSDSIGGALLFTGQVYSPLVTATDTFYVERTNGTCTNTGGRTQWIITITPPPALTASASINPICENSSTTLSVDAGTVGNYNTYIWAPATGLSATTGSSVVATPLVTTTYTVFGSDATLGDPSCSNIALITVNVNPAPILLSNTVSPALVCSGDSANINLSIQGVGGSGATSTVAFIDFENPLLPSGWSATGLWHVTTACPTGTPPNPTRWAYYGQDGTCTFDNGGTNTGDLTSATFAIPPTAISAKVRFRFVYNGESGAPPTGFDNASVRTSINGGAFTQAASLSTNGSNSTWLSSEFNINSAIGGTVALQWNFNTVDDIGNASLGLQIDSVAITYVNPASSFSYAWTPAAGLSSTSVADPEAFPVSTTTYSCTVTNTVTGCTKEFTSTVNVTPLPKPIITPGDTSLCVNDNDSYYVHAVDTGAYAGGYPPGTTFDWNDLNGPVLSDSVVVGQTELLNSLVSVTVTLPPVMGSCVGISNTVTLNFQEPETKIFMYQDSVDGCTNFTGELRAENLFGGAPFRYIWVNTMGDTIRDVIGSTSYSGPYDSDGDLILDDFDLDLIPDIYTIYTDTIGGLAVGTYTVYVISNANSPYPPPSCISSNSIALGRTICGLHNGNPPELIDPCICVNNKDEYNRTGPTDGQFQETISMLGGNSPWTLVSLTSGSGRPFSNSVAPVCTGDNLLETTPVTTADIVEVIPDDSSYITFYFFDGDTYTATFLDSNGDTLSISGGGCSYPAAPRTDTAIWICLDSTNINLQDAAFPNGVDPGITLNWWDDSTCVSNPLAYGDLDDIPINYPDIHDVYNPGPNGMGYTIYNFYVSADSVADATCDGVRSMISVYSNTVDAEITSITNVDCNGEATGAVDITVTNGTAPFTFLWSNGSTDEDLSNVVATTYTLMITDSLGCVRMIDVEILENPAFAIGKVITPNMCHGDSTGQIAVYVSGAVPGPGYIYQWSNGATTAINSDLVAGTYTLTVTDSLGCDTIMTFYIFEPTMLDKNMTISQPLCNGQTGSVNIAAFGGTPWSGGGVHAAGYDYSLDGGAAQSSGIFAGISAGTHTVLITDSNGCNLAVVFTITEPAALICDGSVSNAMCNGSSDGMITSNITGGTAPYTYSWSTGATTQSVNNLSAGIYTVTVTDANGCTISCTYTVGEPAAITFSLTACDNIKCFGGSDGKACLNNVAGGTGPYTYQWNTVPVQTTAMATGLTAGTWTVTITDAMGCMVSGNVTLTQPSAALTLSGAITNASCNGGTNGAINLTISGGTAAYSVLWSNGSISEDQTGLAAGTYSVTVTDANGCTATASYTVGQAAALAINLSLSNVSCNGGSNGSIIANVSGGSGSYSYSWSNGNTSASILNLGAGIYTVTVTDASGCTVSASGTISEPSALGCICNASVTNVSCFGGSNGSVTAQPLGGTAPYSYVWSNGALTQTINNLTAGTYTVTITDANGCTKVGTATVTQPNQLFVFVNGTNPACNGATSGSATSMTIGGTGPYTYSWNTVPVQTNSIATGLGVGTYTVTVTDANGCIGTASVTLTAPPALNVTSKKTNVSCHGGSNGTITVVPSGGTAPYSYAWSNGKTTKFVIGLAAGTYTVTVTDAGGCTKTLSVTITQPSAMLAIYSVTNVSCNGGSNGAIDLTVTGGTPAYTYLWSTGATTQDITGLAAGAYSVTVKDKRGCILNAVAIITQPSGMIVSMSPKNPKCFGATNGQATASVTGGMTPYTYAWSNGQTTAAATGLAAGTYTVTVTDANGCTKTGSVTLSQPSVLTCTANVLQTIACNGATTGKIGVTVTGGTPGYTYTWNTVPVATTAIVNNIGAGTYTVIVKDKNNCTTSCSVTLTQPAAITCDPLTSTAVSCNGGNDGTATISGVTGGTSPYTYLWNTGVAQTTTTATGLTAGTYTVIVTDANGCTKTASVTVTQPTALAATFSTTQPTCAPSTGTATVTASGGTMPYSYLWSDGQTTATASALAAGTYSVTVTDANGCTVQVTGIVINAGSTLTASPLTGVNVLCNGGNNGSATISGIAGGTAPYSISWNTVPTQGSMTATGLMAGTYTVTVTDAQGCTYTASIEITEPANPVTASIPTVVPISCTGGGTASATALGAGGTPGYTYLWSDGQTTDVAIGLVAGGYIVTVTDANGCTATASVTITQPGGLVLNISGTDALCNAGTSGTATVVATVAPSPYTYLWSNGQTDATATGLASGTYTVTVTDASGCVDSIEIEIVEPSAMITGTSQVNVKCNGASTGSAAINVVGGTPGYSYAWSNGSSTKNVSGLAAGTYTVTITDANGCTITANVTITEPAAIVITPTQTDVACNGQNTGSATASVSGGTAPYTYAWSNGQNSATISGLTAGTYTVTVTDNNGCTASNVYVLTTASAIVVNPSQTTIACHGGTSVLLVSPTGGSGTYTYSWSHDGGNTTNTATVTAGVYYATVTDSAGCSVTYCFVVNQPSALACGITQVNVTCNGLTTGSATVNGTGGTGLYTYAWSNGQTMQTATGLGAGTYTATVTDGAGCTSTCTVTITEPTALSVGTSNTNVSCVNPTGTAMAVVGGGTPPYTYLWSNGATTSAISGLAAGSYTVTVNDANGCGPISATAVIGAPTPVTCTASVTQSISCSGYQNGQATVVPGGGNGVYNVIWNTAPAQTTLTATGMGAGTYTVTVFDSDGCSSQCTVTVTEPGPLVYSFSTGGAVCQGGNNGTATITPVGGTPYTVGNAYVYLWSNGQTTQTATGLSAGAVYVTITDSMGCTVQAAIILTQSAALNCNTTCTPTSCGQAVGTATVNVFGGTPPYVYQWSNGGTNGINTGLVAGVYTVLITDASGCTTTCTAMVGQAAAIQYSLQVTNALCNGGNGSISITNLNGGSAPYGYVWTNAPGDTIDSLNTSITALAGWYYVTVTDSNGCTKLDSAQITEPAIMVATASGINVSCNGQSNGSASVVTTGGVAPYSYAWNNGASQSMTANLGVGTYTVTVTDVNGCMATASIEITQPAVLDTISTSSTDANCGLCDGTGTVTMTGGTAPYSYLWSNGQTTQTGTNLCSGNNFVQVTDANGCVVSVCVKVGGGTFTATLNSPTYAGGVNIRCNGGLDGSINLTTNPQGAYTYTWSSGATTEDLMGVGAGTYTVTVSNGVCTQTVSITLTEPAALTATASGTNVNCNGNNNGTATVAAMGGVSPYSYSWSNGQTTVTATGLMAGTYTVTVTDANGCTATASYVVTAPVNGLNITETHVNPTCNGSSNGSINITVTGGTAPYTYIWTGGATTEDRTGLAAGSHTVTVTDANGCTITLCVVLVGPNPLVLSQSCTNTSCSGGANGSSSVAVAGGTAPYIYTWNTFASSSTITGLPAGTYTVTVTDANGCSASSSCAVITPVTVAVVVDSTRNATSFGGNDGAAYISVAGGTSPYTYQWNTIPVKTTQDVTGLTAGNYQVTVTDAGGCVAFASVTITQPNYLCSPTLFHTEFPAQWSVAPSGNNIGTYLVNHFPAAFPASLVVGGGCGVSKTLSLTNSTAVRNFLLGQPLTGGATVLTSNLTNPTSGTFNSSFAALVVSLKMAVVFDAYDPNFAPLPTVTLGNLIYNGPAPFTGMTVTQILNKANERLGGCSTPGFTTAQCSTAVWNTVNAYAGGSPGSTVGMFSCPAPPKAADGITSTTGLVNLYPNPTNGVMNISFSAVAEGKVTVRVYDAIGRVVFMTEEAAFEGVNTRTYDISKLSDGMYLVNVQVDGLTETVRMIVR